MEKKTKARRRRWLLLPALLVLLAAGYYLLQHVWPHRVRPFVPDYAPVELAATLDRDVLSEADYALLYAQTGLSPTAIEDLRALGQAGRDQIIETQRLFFQPPQGETCAPLGYVTREHRYYDEAGKLVYGVPLAPLKPGDILVSFSTHTAGWRHGHAGLVLDPEGEVTLEAVVLGSDSSRMNLRHWRTYSTLMVLRPKADDALRLRAVEYAETYLEGKPYSLISGVFGPKFQPEDGPHSGHCAYLPWCAWASQGIDLDGDGGKVVTVGDLAAGDRVEVIQIWGLDPGDYPLGG